MVEKRTVTTQVEFYDVDEWWERKTPDELKGDIRRDRHYLHDSLRDPPAQNYESKCPHEFSLHRQKTILLPVGGSKHGSDELVLHLSDSLRTMYTGWSMYWSFSFDRKEKRRIIRKGLLTPHSDPIEWKTITMGKTADVKKQLEGPGFDGIVYFFARFSCEDAAATLHSTQRELDELRRAMELMRKMVVETFDRPLIDITRLVFRSKRSRNVKNLYVPSHILTQFEYFRKCHSPEYLEAQHVETPKRKRDEIEKPSEELYCDDSDDEWDSDSEDLEPEKKLTFKATICVTGTARRTYRAFIDYSVCGALHFSPLRSAYEEYCKTKSVEAPKIAESSGLSEAEQSSENPEMEKSSKMDQTSDDRLCTPWPKWAEAHSTPHTAVPGFKTLASPKSLYRLADMLIIPKLKAICHKQIIASLDATNLTTEIQSPVFEQHKELRVDAYKLVRKHWKSLTSSDRISLITHLPQDEAALVDQHILMDICS